MVDAYSASQHFTYILPFDVDEQSVKEGGQAVTFTLQIRNQNPRERLYLAPVTTAQYVADAVSPSILEVSILLPPPEKNEAQISHLQENGSRWHPNWDLTREMRDKTGEEAPR